jgi:hypothetical protein
VYAPAGTTAAAGSVAAEAAVFLLAASPCGKQAPSTKRTVAPIVCFMQCLLEVPVKSPDLMGRLAQGRRQRQPSDTSADLFSDRSEARLAAAAARNRRRLI